MYRTKNTTKNSNYQSTFDLYMTKSLSSFAFVIVPSDFYANKDIIERTNDPELNIPSMSDFINHGLST